MQESKIKIANKIVTFWHLMEFLSQESFPQNTTENRKKVETVKEKQKRHNRISKFTLFYEFPLPYNITDIIKSDQNLYKNSYPECSSHFHLCVGKIKREILVNKLYECLKIEDDRPEKDQSEICLIGFKVDKEGIYKKNSISLSPLVWGIYTYCMSGKTDKITINHYYQNLKELEDKLNKEEPLQEVNIRELYDHVLDKYIKPLYGNMIDRTIQGCFIYTRYDSEKTCKREDDKAEDFSNLVNGFFIEDLEMVKDSLSKRNTDSDMYVDIIDYIVSPYEEFYEENKEIMSKNRIDIRNSKINIEKWLYADKAPSGKWPSKFNPALMQQIAINMGTSETNEVRNIFSVNGPPGTGKTTLLKEIIASNIVERAKLISQYEHADDAFEERFFEDGNQYKKGYDKYYYKYHAFKDEKLLDYSMIVASCNNAAVENITKELPSGKALLAGLNPDKNTEEEAAGELEKIMNLFDVSKNGSSESYKVYNLRTGKMENVKKWDVYFSWLAQKLMSNSNETDESDINEWGLISAPMGKASNIGNYCYHVLNEVINSFYENNEMIRDRHCKYLMAKKEFNNQLSKVEKWKKRLGTISRLPEKYRKREKRYKQFIAIYKEDMNKCMATLREDFKFVQSLERAKSVNIKKYMNDLKQLSLTFQELDDGLKKLKIQQKEIREHLIKQEDSRKWYEILFGKWMRTERLRQISKCKEELSIIRKKILDKNKEKEQATNRYKDQMKSIETYKQQLSSQLRHKRDSIHELSERMDKKVKLIERAHHHMVKSKDKLQNLLGKYRSDMKVLDEAFWHDFESKDDCKSTEIQTLNPWVTDQYNREREKLFYAALQVHKEFILSSKACRDNFINLSMLWKYRENNDGELCMYSQRDKDKTYKHLLNTLFLLTPVISTTFASVGRFLRNIKEQGSIGLLIIDEAGQAAPHVALGALWRCKKAIVVGDPKQVEPVVTGDADAIKKAFSNKVIIPYLNKTISVQEFADKINNYGSYINDAMNGSTKRTWVGCPLVVHRRCIHPMFNISNVLSYDGTMKLQTGKPKSEDERKFLIDRSCWINIDGKEYGNKNHFVPEQGEKAVEMIINSFKKYNGIPDLYVISPFTTVIKGIKDMVKESVELMEYKEAVDKWIENYCGTVHKFQGKEAKEVIFVLGCDEKAISAVKWVKPNIVNVAATRAKFRLYIIGNYNVWKESKIFKITKSLIDNCNVYIGNEKKLEKI